MFLLDRFVLSSGILRQKGSTFPGMVYLAHTENERGISHLLKDHLLSVGELASKFAAEMKSGDGQSRVPGSRIVIALLRMWQSAIQ